MLEQDLIDLESRCVVALQGICERITRRTAQFLPPTTGVTLDVTAKVRAEETGTSIMGTATVELWLTGAGLNADSTIAQDWAQLVVGYARETLHASPSEIPELAQHTRTDYLTVESNQTGEEWLHVYRAVQQVEVQTRAGGAAIDGINIDSAATSPDHALAARARSTALGLLVSSTLDIEGTPIPVAWVNALAGDEVELLDADETVVDVHVISFDGPGTHSFANAAAGTFGARLMRASVEQLRSITTATRIAQQG